VDHAGEFGAIRIYSGQSALIQDNQHAQKIQEMYTQELVHVDLFTKLIQERRVRPSALSPLWHVGAYALGMGTALLGKEAAMACTEAVEEVISDHYNDQLREYIEKNPDDIELREVIRKCRDDEIEHQKTAVEYNAHEAKMYNIIYPAIKTITTTAVWIATRI